MSLPPNPHPVDVFRCALKNLDEGVQRLPDNTELVASTACFIYHSFERYDQNFRHITARAADHFLRRNWIGAQADRIERLELWQKSIDRTAGALKTRLGAAVGDRHFWHQLKEYYGVRIDRFTDAEFARTFFTSVNRHIFNPVGVDPLIEFVLDLNTQDDIGEQPPTRVYIHWSDLTQLFRMVLHDFAFSVPYKNIARDIAHLQTEIERLAWRHYRHPQTLLRIELIQTVFYQSTRAFLVGKAEGKGWIAPLIIGLANTASGIEVESVSMSETEVGALLGFTRSYFFVDLAHVRGAVHYLKHLLPNRPVDELYSVLGRIRQAKTERYRYLARFLHTTTEYFMPAPGIKGMIMIVFTHPSYHLVFKVIRDRFNSAKKITRSQVIERYQLVSRHDRIGRMLDTQAFRRVAFPRNIFSAVVLEELLTEAAGTVRLHRDQVVFELIYMERKVRPLNLFLQEATWTRAHDAVLDYGQSIKDMAYNNIFPGDMLLKNFGVTRSGRVIFYDYDEVTLLTDCTVRSLPKAHDDLIELSGEHWFETSEYDLFPEQFNNFLGLKPALKQVFLDHHADLLTPAFWRQAQALHQQ